MAHPRLALTCSLPALLATLFAARASAQPPDARCDGAAAARLLGVKSLEWQVACWRIDGGRQVIAAVPLVPLGPSPGPTAKAKAREGGAGPLVVRVALASGDRIVWRDEVHPERNASAEVREVLDKSEEWLVGIEDQPLGHDRGLRVGVVGHWGGDVMSVREIVLLYRLLPEGGLRLVWTGIGNTRESRFDYCRLEGIATFQLVDDHTLERALRLTPSIDHDKQLPRARARALEKKCVVKEQEPQRFPLLGAPATAPSPAADARPR